MRNRDPRTIAAAILGAYTLVALVFLALRLGGNAEAVGRSLETAVTPSPVIGGVITTVEIPPGASADDIVQRLTAAGVLVDGESFRALLGFSGVGPSLQAGRFELRPGMPPAEVLRLLRLGPDVFERITFRGGLRLEEIGEILDREGIFTLREWEDALEDAPRTPLAATRPEGATLLGYLLPETYQIDDETTAADLLREMLERFEEQVTPEMVQQARERGMSLHEVLTLASLVEREAVHADEAPTVASVFLNRLAEGMALQADPSVQFALTLDEDEGRSTVQRYGWWKAGLTVDDLEYDSPYNTYLYPGLPPGPIANPTIESIRAVIEPEVTDYLYFVASPACDGRHLFASNLDEHNANVERFRASGCAED